MAIHHKHIPYGHIRTTMEEDNLSKATEPLLHDEGGGEPGLDPNIPPLNSEDPLFGLRSNQVAASREVFGTNEIVIPETPLWRLFLNQFIGFLVRHSFVVLVVASCPHALMCKFAHLTLHSPLLIRTQPLLIEVAALVSASVGDWPDFGIILAMLFVNAVLGFREEYHAKKSLDELSESLESEIATRREGETVQLNVKELVPGDVVLLVGGTSEFPAAYAPCWIICI